MPRNRLYKGDQDLLTEFYFLDKDASFTKSHRRSRLLAHKSASSNIVDVTAKLFNETDVKPHLTDNKEHCVYLQN